MTAARSSCCCLILLFAAAALSADTTRPKIGLALGGGGARGCAHVGVLRVLEQMHIPVDYIAGTSMGAAVGALYASGLSADEIEQALTTIDWRDALSDHTRFKDLSFRRKEDESRYLTEFEAGLRGRRLALPLGLRSGQKLRFIVQSHLIPVAGIHDFSKLPIPFKAVAADIETGDAVVLDHGDLEEAIRASMSIPGVFAPIRIDGRMLVDGGLADNVPVDVVRAMGADIVIAVDVGSPLLKTERLGSYFSVTNQVLTLLTRRNAEAQIAGASVVIVPPVADFGTLDFEDAGRIVAAGQQEAERQRTKLETLAVTPDEFASLAAQRPKRDDSQRDVEFINVEGSRRVDHRIVRAHMLTKPAQPLDIDLLRHDITRIYGLDDFESVTFAMRQFDGMYGLALSMKDKSWGPTYVRFGIRAEDDLRGNSSFTVGVSVTRTRLNALGAEWRNDIHLGAEQGYSGEFYQPLDFGGHFFVAPGVQFVRTKSSYWQDSRRLAEYGVTTAGASLDLGLALGEWGEVRTGVVRARIHSAVDTGAVDLPSGRVDYGAFRTGLQILRVDNPSIPHDGGNFAVRLDIPSRSLGGEADYRKLQAGVALFTTVKKRLTFYAGAEAGTNLGSELPAYDQFALGGMLSLAGFAPGQLSGNRFAAVHGAVYYRVRDLPQEFGEGIYVGSFVDAGNAWAAGQPAAFSETHSGASLAVGAQTIAGPIILGYGWADTGDHRFYLTIGKAF